MNPDKTKSCVEDACKSLKYVKQRRQGLLISRCSEQSSSYCMTLFQVDNLGQMQASHGQMQASHGQLSITSFRALAW